MLDPKVFEELSSRLIAASPAADIEKNALLSGFFARLDSISREELISRRKSCSARERS